MKILAILRETLAYLHIYARILQGKKLRKSAMGGFRCTVLASCPIINITNQPQKVFYPTRLIVPGRIGHLFNITDIKVGNRSQLVSSGNIPASAFSEIAIPIPLRGDPAFIAQAVTVQVQNMTKEDQTFECCVEGWIEEDGDGPVTIPGFSKATWDNSSSRWKFL